MSQPLGPIIAQMQKDFPEALYMTIILPNGTAWEAYDSKQLPAIIRHLQDNLEMLQSRFLEQVAVNN